MPHSVSIDSEMIIATLYSMIEEAYDERRFPPSIREMCAEVGLSSTSSVHRYLRIMAARGMIILVPGVNRGIMLPPKEDDNSEIMEGETDETDYDEERDRRAV